MEEIDFGDSEMKNGYHSKQDHWNNKLNEYDYYNEN